MNTVKHEADSGRPVGPRWMRYSRWLRNIGPAIRRAWASRARQSHDTNSHEADGASVHKLAGAPAQEPPRERFLAGTFGAESPLNYMLYTPASRGEGPAPPLLVLLHGCQQSAKDFAAGTRMNELAEQHGALVLYPEQSSAANVMRCWNWYAAGVRPAERGDAVLIAAMTASIVREHGVDPARVYVAGLSAGGAMAAVLGRDYPELFAAVGVHSGVPAGAAHSLPSALLAMLRGPSQAALDSTPAPAEAEGSIATIVFHGDRDTTVHPSNGEAIHAAPADQSQPVTAALEWVTEPTDGGHAFTRSVQLQPDGSTQRELWVIHGAGHAWSGGSAAGTHTDALGPDASREMMRFFLQHRLSA
jgi:poly(hydroxyalkanoate) depolymerase family esterase